MQYRDVSAIIHQKACAFKSTMVSNAMIAEDRSATEDELIECYTFLTEGITEFSFEELQREIEKWFKGIFFSHVNSIEKTLRMYLKCDIINDLLYVENERFYHNELYSIRKIANA